MSCGPLPAARPPSEWQKPQVLANNWPTSNFSSPGAVAAFCAAAGATHIREAASTTGSNILASKFGCMGPVYLVEPHRLVRKARGARSARSPCDGVDHLFQAKDKKRAVIPPHALE